MPWCERTNLQNGKGAQTDKLLGNVFFFFLCKAKPAAYGNSQARGRIGATMAGLHHSHSSKGYGPHLLPTLQLMAMPDP